MLKKVQKFNLCTPVSATMDKNDKGYLSTVKSRSNEPATNGILP